MCDACKDEAGIMRLLKLRSDLPDAITRAAKRLQCYYECVTRGEDIFEEDDPEEEWEPEY